MQVSEEYLQRALGMCDEINYNGNAVKVRPVATSTSYDVQWLRPVAEYHACRRRLREAPA